MVARPTFWVEISPIHDTTMTSYEKSSLGPCPHHGEYHRAVTVHETRREPDLFPKDGYPTICSCAYVFTDKVEHSGSSSPRYTRMDNGEELRSPLPEGALLAVEPFKDAVGNDRVGADGLSVVCVCPGNQWWYIDSRASNCTMKDDYEHRCWVRHGTKGGTIHVDKAGLTCAAGAGSIQIGDWHGFLHNGILSEEA